MLPEFVVAILDEDHRSRILFERSYSWSPLPPASAVIPPDSLRRPLSTLRSPSIGNTSSPVGDEPNTPAIIVRRKKSRGRQMGLIIA